MVWYDPRSWFRKKPQVVAEEPNDFNKPVEEPKPRDFKAEHKALLEEIRRMDLEDKEYATDLKTLITTSVTEKNKDVRKNTLAQKLTEIIKSLEKEKQGVTAMAAENIGGQMLNLQEQISQLEEMSQEEIDEELPLDPNQTEDKIRAQHGTELGNLWSAYRHSITQGRRLETDINKRVKTLNSQISKFQKTEISAHQANLTLLEDELREYEEELKSITDQLLNSTEVEIISQLQNRIETLIKKHERRTNIKSLETFEERLGQITSEINRIQEEKQKLITQREETKSQISSDIKNYRDARAVVPKPNTASSSKPPSTESP